jgi:hypothetical protein
MTRPKQKLDSNRSRSVRLKHSLTPLRNMSKVLKIKTHKNAEKRRKTPEEKCRVSRFLSHLSTWWQCYKTFFSLSPTLRTNKLECLHL